MGSWLRLATTDHLLLLAVSSSSAFTRHRSRRSSSVASSSPATASASLIRFDATAAYHGAVLGLVDRDVLVISQKPKLIEMTNEYTISDPDGTTIGTIRQEGQSKAKKLVRLIGDIDQFLTHRLVVYDVDGTSVMQMVRPRKILKSTLQILGADGSERGRIVQRNVVGKKYFALQNDAGDDLGRIDAENWRSWNFAIEDAQGIEVGRITKNWAGVLKEVFTTADHYLLEVTGSPSPDLRFLMVGAAAGIDTALKQDDTGGAGFGGIDLFN